MKKYILGIILVLLIILYTFVLKYFFSFNGIIITDTNDLYKVTKSTANNIIIVDLRDTDDFKAGHITNSVNLPFNDEGAKLLYYLKSQKYYRKNIYLLCYSGLRSAQAYNLLMANDFYNVNYVKFGYNEYAESIGEKFIPETGECRPCMEFE